MYKKRSRREKAKYNQTAVPPQPRPFAPSYIHKFTSPGKYVDDKITMLETDFEIDLNLEDRCWLRSFKTEGEINTAVKELLNKYWARE